MIAILLHDLLDDAARRRPGAPAISQGDTVMTYGEVDAASRRVAEWLLARGVRRGDRVAVIAPNRPEVTLVPYACSRIGAVFVVLHEQVRGAGLAHVLVDAEPALLITDQAEAAEAGVGHGVPVATLAAVGAIAAGTPAGPAIGTPLAAIGTPLAAIGTPLAAAGTPLAVDPICLIYTSGSTGLPKAVVSTHAQLVFAARAIQSQLHWTGSPWFAEGSYWILFKPLRIVLIIALAVLLRYLLHRSINRLVRTTTRSTIPGILRPLRERIPEPVPDPAAVVPERRRQRAEAIGSVLRSGVTAVVFSIAALTVLSELSVDLGPLLASAGIAGVAIGFGAQTLVKDLIAGLFMLLEDQYGVGDTVDLGEATGTVESVGLRITTVRDGRGVLWYIRNGEIIRVGNKSQGWAMVIVDLPVGFANTEEATGVLRVAAQTVAEDPALAPSIVEPPDVLGVEQITVDGAVIRTVAKTTAEGQFAVARELRRRLVEALGESGITGRIAAARMFPRPAAPAAADDETGQGGPT